MILNRKIARVETRFWQPCFFASVILGPGNYFSGMRLNCKALAKNGIWERSSCLIYYHVIVIVRLPTTWARQEDDDWHRLGFRKSPRLEIERSETSPRQQYDCACNKVLELRWAAGLDIALALILLTLPRSLFDADLFMGGRRPSCSCKACFVLLTSGSTAQMSTHTMHIPAVRLLTLSARRRNIAQCWGRIYRDLRGADSTTLSCQHLTGSGSEDWAADIMRVPWLYLRLSTSTLIPTATAARAHATVPAFTPQTSEDPRMILHPSAQCRQWQRPTTML